MATFKVIPPAIASLSDRFARIPTSTVALVSTLCVVLIGSFDYSTTEISFGVAYMAPIVVAAWFVGRNYAALLSILSVGLWLYGDIKAGVVYSNYFSSIWNYSFQFVFYLFAISLVVKFKYLQGALEKRVDERTADLVREVAERERLERELLQISEREQRRIGQDLHDGLCQHLTGTALIGQALSEQLASKSIPEAERSRKLVDLIEEAIALARRLAKGLHPVEMQADGLMIALDEFSAITRQLFRVDCVFECNSPILIHNSGVAGHLYRIAQEAVSNAVKHGQPKRIIVRLDAQEDGTCLSIADDGSGFPNVSGVRGGIGLQIMAHRAKVIGAKFEVQSKLGGGTVIQCFLPN